MKFCLLERLVKANKGLSEFERRFFYKFYPKEGKRIK